MFRAAENEHLLHLGMAGEQFLEKRSLAALVDAIKFLVDALDGRTLRSDLDAHRICMEN